MVGAAGGGGGELVGALEVRVLRLEVVVAELLVVVVVVVVVVLVVVVVEVVLVADLMILVALDYLERRLVGVHVGGGLRGALYIGRRVSRVLRARFI